MTTCLPNFFCFRRWSYLSFGIIAVIFTSTSTSYAQLTDEEVSRAISHGKQLATQAIQQHRLTDQEKEIALEIESARYSLNLPTTIPVPHLSNTPAGKRKLSVVVAVRPIGTPSINERIRELAEPGDPVLRRRALVIRYEYMTGDTIRTWVDLESDRILTVRRDKYPAPLAQEELDRAIQILRDHSQEIDQFVSTHTDVEFSHRVPHSVGRESSAPSLRGHRLVWLGTPWTSERYLIDLSGEQVLSTRY